MMYLFSATEAIKSSVVNFFYDSLLEIYNKIFIENINVTLENFNTRINELVRL